MGKLRPILLMFVVALVAIYVSNKVAFVQKIVG